jgi:cell wall-associated NlpC family hydrolase
MKSDYKWTMQFHAKVALSFVLLCLLAIPAALAQESQHKTAAPRLLTRREGLTIVRAALHSGRREADCSHLVHGLFERAGFPYDYAPSSELYAGIDEFRRVLNPQPGDLAVWRGHAGIVVSPARHSFFSMLSPGPGVDSWNSPYWMQRGRPRFFRYLKQPPSGTVSSSMRTSMRTSIRTTNLGQ